MNYLEDTCEIQRDVRQFIQNELVRDVQAISDDDSLLEAGVVDSLAVLALVEYVERQYGLKVMEDEMMPENFESIEAIAAFVERPTERSCLTPRSGAPVVTTAVGGVARRHSARAAPPTGMAVCARCRRRTRRRLTEVAIARALDAPEAAPPSREVVRGRNTVAIAIDDLSRPLPASRHARAGDCGSAPPASG